MNMKRIRTFALAAVMLLSLVCFSACSGESGNGEPAYKVKVVDAQGNPYTSGVIVKFMQNGEQAGMQVVNAEGIAEKTLPKGDYTVQLQFTDSDVEYVYDQTDLTLTGEKTQLEIVLSKALQAESRSLTTPDGDVEAYVVDTGCTVVTLNEEKRSYFLFTPTEPGMYEFSVIGSDAAIGYYGAPHFVQSDSAAEVVDNKFSVSVRNDMIGTDNTGTTVLVLGIDAGAGEATLSIQRTGDPEWTVTDEPWTVYETTATLSQYTFPEGATLGEFDLTASTDTYQLVLNEKDGTYHLNSADGPQVLVRLGKNSNGSKYLDPFETILEHSGVSKYFFDAEGNFIKKEKYDDCLLEYFQYDDEQTGLYPLTEDLKYIIQQRGEYSGWWDADSGIYLFRDENGQNIPGINHEIAWLFLCCYIQ